MKKRQLWELLPLVLILGMWQLTALRGWLSPLFFPSPAHLAATAWDLVRSGEIERHLKATVARLLVAFVVGSGLGIPTGLILGGSDFWRRSLRSLLGGLHSTPKLALLPAFLVVFGLNEGARLLPAVLSCFVVTAAYALDAAAAVGPGYLDLARSYGAGRQALFFRVYIPACLPSLFTGMRLALGTALVMVIATELLTSRSGLGSFIWITSQTLALDRMYVGIAACTLLGIAKNLLFAGIERHLTPWMPEQNG